MISGGHPQNSLTPAQMQAQQQQATMASERAKLRSRKPTDKNIPEGVEDCIIGDGVQRYRDLRDFERRLDATMIKKRLDIQDAVNRNVKVSQPSRMSWFGTDIFHSTIGHYEFGSAIQSRTSRGKWIPSTWMHSTLAQIWIPHTG